MAASRVAIGVALAGIVATGYLLRFHAPNPALMRDAAGGAAYVVAATLGLLLIRPRLAPQKVALVGFAFACVVEVSQVVSSPWLDAVRATRLGRLVLGTTFAWGDFGPYAVGGLLAWAMAACLHKTQPTIPASDKGEPLCPNSGRP